MALQRSLLTLVGLTMTCFISYSWIRGFMPNLPKKSRLVSNLYVDKYFGRFPFFIFLLSSGASLVLYAFKNVTVLMCLKIKLKGDTYHISLFRVFKKGSYLLAQTSPIKAQSRTTYGR